MHLGLLQLHPVSRIMTSTDDNIDRCWRALRRGGFGDEKFVVSLLQSGLLPVDYVMNNPMHPEGPKFRGH